MRETSAQAQGPRQASARDAQAGQAEAGAVKARQVQTGDEPGREAHASDEPARDAQAGDEPARNARAREAQADPVTPGAAPMVMVPPVLLEVAVPGVAPAPDLPTPGSPAPGSSTPSEPDIGSPAVSAISAVSAVSATDGSPTIAPPPLGSPVPAPLSVGSPLVGSPAPDFTLPDQHGADRSLPTLSSAVQSLPGHSPASQLTSPRPIPTTTLLVFYPFAFSRICGGELRELQSALPEFDAHGVGLLAVSCDPMYALRVYAEQEGFDFPLLSDFWPHGAVARAYGVFDEARGCARRGSFLIDQEGIVRWSVVNPISEARPLADYLSVLTQLTPS